MEKPNLIAAFETTRYRVDLPGGWLELRVGHSSDQITRRLSLEAGVQRNWALVTPFNPGAARTSERANRQRLAQMKAYLECNPCTWFDAENVDPVGAWPVEKGCFLVDPGLAYATLLAQRFGQAALLHGEVGGSPRLHWL